MGPTTTNKESHVMTIKGLNLPKLAEDGSNWTLYQEWLGNTITATKGLRRHLCGTMQNPEELEQHSDKKWYIKAQPQHSPMKKLKCMKMLLISMSNEKLKSESLFTAQSMHQYSYKSKEITLLKYGLNW